MGFAPQTPGRTARESVYAGRDFVEASGYTARRPSLVIKERAFGLGAHQGNEAQRHNGQSAFPSLCNVNWLSPQYD